MGNLRAFVPHVRWTDQEISVLREHYERTPWGELERLLPGRKPHSMRCKANALGLVRYMPPPRSPDEIRKAKREGMARRWRENPEAMRAYARANHSQRKHIVNARIREMNATRIFWARAQKLRGVSARELFGIWRTQKGLCALTGRKLGRDAQVDHITPRARGGTDELSNLQWVCAEANLAKRDLTDAEFHALCGEVVRWIGERIQAVEAIGAAKAEAA